MTGAAATSEDVEQRPRPAVLLGLLVVAAVVGVVVSLASWAFLVGIHQLQQGLFDHLPGTLGFDGGAPLWWPLPILAVSGLVVAFAIVRLPGRGGHSPVAGLATGATQPEALPGVVLAATATLALGVVLGPESPLIAIGSGLGILAVRLVRRDAPDTLRAVVAAAGSFAAISFVFGSPLVGAVILIEASALDRRGLMIVLPTGLLAAGVGSLVSIGLGSWTGLSTSDFALGQLPLPSFARPVLADFAWTIPLAVVVAVVIHVGYRLAGRVQPLLMRRPFALLPLAGLVIGGLAILFEQTTDKQSAEVLFSGQDQLAGLVQGAGAWSVTALALVMACKGLAWSVSLAGFRGGPTFPGLYLGAAGGLLATHLPGLGITPAVAVGMGAATVAVLRLPLAAVVLATVLTAHAGAGAEPLIIVGVVAAFGATLALSARDTPGAGTEDRPADRPAAAAPPEPALQPVAP